MKLLFKLVASTISVFAAAYTLPGVGIDDLKTAAIVAIVLGTLNLIVKPILVILTLPITILTLGIFYLLINALMVIITASIVPHFEVGSLLSALLFGICVSIFNSILYSLVDKK